MLLPSLLAVPHLESLFNFQASCMNSSGEGNTNESPKILCWPTGLQLWGLHRLHGDLKAGGAIAMISEGLLGNCDLCYRLDQKTWFTEVQMRWSGFSWVSSSKAYLPIATGQMEDAGVSCLLGRRKHRAWRACVTWRTVNTFVETSLQYPWMSAEVYS